MSYDYWRPNQALRLDLWLRETTGAVTADWSKTYRPPLTLVDVPVWQAATNDLTVLAFSNNDAIYSLAADSTDLNFTSGDFSGAAWIAPSAYGTRFIFDKSSVAGTEGWSFWLAGAGGYLAFTTYQAGPASQTTYGGANLALDVWQLVGFTRSGDTAHIYLNGVDTTNTPATHVNPATAAAVNTYIGAAVGAGAGWYNGLLWRTRIWNRALASWEFNAMYQAERTLLGV
jgi:hypothetical protein